VRDFTSPLLAPARVWESATPFLATRYPKLSGSKRDRPEVYATARHFTVHVLRDELDRLRRRRPDLPAVQGIDALDCIRSAASWRPTEFARLRHKCGDDGGRRPAGAFRVTFAGPVRGPLCLGHSCHFGLGLFMPAAE
jgi:CRISPR-associated protein Csb2